MQKIIVAVDDESSVLRSLNRMFRNKEYEFISFDSPVDALQALKKIKPHIIISDQRMPHIHGVDFLSRAKNISQRSFRIMLTGFKVRGDGGEHHIDRVMMKPWDNDELEQKVMETTVQHDKIYVPIHDACQVVNVYSCSICGQSEISHEIRFENFTEFTCYECKAKLLYYSGTSMESMLINQMMGNVI